MEQERRGERQDNSLSLFQGTVLVFDRRAEENQI
jgi:hypothetical protein